ncbi:tetratricopeptide repeat protein [Nocardioides humi]|uniref:Tetratricopeptide repeat protein n=1 Tax=Nocardioides humi TaxID=449461 RepID=A0ABN1ZPF9_9ACTN|nr:tetratricopeptide repeat protein [Nocardioides humi]
MRSWDDVAATLRELRTRAGSPSYTRLAAQVGQRRAAQGRPEHTSRTAVYDCFRDGRVRMDLALLEDLGAVLGLSGTEATAWSASLFAVQNGIDAARIVASDPDPATTATFVGRTAELTALRAHERGVFLISGVGGVGKTQLAIRAARDHVRDGRADRLLLVDLRGYDETRPGADPAAVRHELLKQLVDAPPRGLPAPEEQRALRAALVERRCVLLLDNAASADEIAAVLGAVGPDECGSLVLATSRAGLDWPLAQHLALDGLDPVSAVWLLAAYGRAVPVEDHDTALALAALVGHHPLALELTAHRLAERPDWSLADHLAATRHEHDLLRLDQPVSASLELSFRALDPGAGRTLRLIAEQPCGHLPAEAVAELLGADLASTTTWLDGLAAAHLVSGPPDRIVLHDLVRVAARAWGPRQDSPSERDAARERLVDHCLRAAERAIAATGMLSYAPGQPAPDGGEPAEDADHAWSWLTRERTSLIALVDPAYRPGPEATVRMSRLLGRYLDTQGLHQEAVVLHGWAVDAALGRADDSGAIGARGHLAAAHARLGHAETALRETELILAGADPATEAGADASATARTVRGVLAVHRGDLEQALDEFRAALALVDTGRTVRTRTGLLGNIGVVLTHLSRFPEAIAHQQEVLDLALRDRDWSLASSALNNLVDNQLADGSPNEALRAAERACDLAERYGVNAAASRTNLGVALTALDRYDEARAAHRLGSAAAREARDPDLVAAIANNLGDTERAAGDLDAARAAYSSALRHVVHADGFEAQRAREGLALTG